MRLRKLIISIIITLILLLAWHLLFRLPLLRVHPLEAVSTSTAIVLSFPDGRLALSPSSEAERLLSSVLNENQYAADLGLLRQALKGQQRQAFPLLLSLQNPGAEHLALMAIADLRGQHLNLETLVKQLPATKSQQLYYQNQKLYRVFLKDRREVTFAQYRNLLLVASYPLLVEDAIGRLTQPYNNWLWKKSFRPLTYRPASGTPFSIFINTANLPLLLSNWLQGAGDAEVKNWQTVLPWLRIDAKFGKEPVAFSGRLTTAADDNLWNALATQHARPIGAMMRVIPDNVAMVQWLSVSNVRRLVRGASEQRAAHFQKYIAPWVGNELGLVRMQDERFVVLKMADPQKATAKLEMLATEVGQLKSYQYGTFEVKQLMDETLFEPLFGTEGLKNPCYAFLEKYVVFASSRSALEVWLDEYIVDKTMGRSTDFLQLYQQWRDRPIQAFVYLNMVNFAPSLRENLQTQTLLKDEQLEQWGHIGLILKEKGGDWNMEGYWTPTATAMPTQANIAWKTSLEYEAITPPMLVGKGTSEAPYLLAVQDTAFQLYLLDVAGNLIAKKKLDSKILSGVQGISYYKSGEQQLIFNTANNIYLTDRVGENQGTFPLRLQTPATNGMTVVDFDGNQQYSFFVACANGGIYGFDQLGRPLQGWNPLRGVGEVRHPILHFQDNSKDFLIALSEAGKLSAFKRDGSNRFAAVNFGTQCPSPPQVQLSGKENRIVATDKNGKAHVVRLDGSTFGLGLFPKAESEVRFVFADVTGDARKDYIALADTSLVVFSYEGTQFKPAFRLGFATPQREVLTVQVPGTEKARIGTVSASKQQISILKDSKVHPDFPLGGTTRFFVTDLFKNGQQILVVANGDSVYAYRVHL